jgi:hypothetical protein
MIVKALKDRVWGLRATNESSCKPFLPPASDSHKQELKISPVLA